jgi:hypothetical protein
MVDVIGHLGMALVWLSPAWYFVDRPKTETVFVGGGCWFGLVPDADLLLSNWFAGVHHHGLFHTVLAVTLLAPVLGAILGWGFAEAAKRTDWFSSEGEKNAYELGVVAVWIAGLSHLFADMLSAPDVAQRIEPFWPLYDGSVVFLDVFWYTSWWATWGLLVLGLVVNVAAWYWTRGRRESARSAAPST